MNVEIDEVTKHPKLHVYSIEELTVDDFKEHYKELMRHKPKQLSIGDFYIAQCDNCHFNGILHIKQTFCPHCKKMVDVLEKDANFNFEEIFQSWVDRKKYLENILNGDVQTFILSYKENNRLINDDYKSLEEIEDTTVGEEVLVDEPIEC